MLLLPQGRPTKTKKFGANDYLHLLKINSINILFNEERTTLF